MTRVLLIGIAVQDFVYAVDTIPTRPEKTRAKTLAVVGGGLAGNAAVAVARLGGSASLITRLGDDIVGRAIQEEFAREGVSTDMTRTFPGRRSPTSAILVDAAGERLVVSYSDPELPTTTEWLPDTLPAGTNAVLGDSRWEQSAKHLFRIAAMAGTPAVLDLDRAVADPSVIAAASHTAMSMQALRELTGDTDPVAGLNVLRTRFPGWLCVTDGTRGCWWTDGEAIRHTPAFAVTTVDTLGAGDTFHGALALALGEGRAVPEAVRFASAAAALKCATFGGRAGIPTRAAVEAFLATNPGVHP
jgi:sulfofructose kinase